MHALYGVCVCEEEDRQFWGQFFSLCGQSQVRFGSLHPQDCPTNP